MSHAIELLKKHWVPIAAIVAGIIAWLYLRKSSAAPVDPTAGLTTPNVQYATPATTGGGGASFVDTSGGSQSTLQPATSSSGVSSSDPSVIPYVSPSVPVNDPSAAAAMAATANPYARVPNVNTGSDPFGLAPQVAQNQIADYSIPKSTGIISAIQAVLTGTPATSPAGGATTVDPALANTLRVAAQPGGLAALPSADPNLTSSGYENLQRSILAGPGCCTVDANGNGGPNSPCCQVSQSTGELATGAPTAASETYKGSVYCEGNDFNAQFFGTSRDTQNCNGPNPTGGLIAGLINQYIPQVSAGPSWGANSGIGNLPPNWNQLTRAQQDAWSATGVIPPPSAPASPAPSTTQSVTTVPTGGIATGGSPVNFGLRSPGAGSPIVPSHPGSSYTGAFVNTQQNQELM